MKLAPNGYSAQVFKSFIAAIYIILHDIIKSMIAVEKPHAATINGNDNIPVPVVVPIIRKIEPMDLVFILKIIVKIKLEFKIS
ncbi:hypothetical protein fh0823_05030 [Francisella halioticida]|nr:hypothetical protein fh0823_05030 [Francisella halioticida]